MNVEKMNVDLRNKITRLQCSWVKRLFEDDFHDWKVIPLLLIGKKLGNNFVIKINTFHTTVCHLNPIQNTNTRNFTFCVIRF